LDFRSFPCKRQLLFIGLKAFFLRKNFNLPLSQEEDCLYFGRGDFLRKGSDEMTPSEDRNRALFGTLLGLSLLFYGLALVYIG
jgi:hypothetical protein